MADKVPSDGIIVQNAKLAVKTELKKSGHYSNPLPDLMQKPGKFIWNTAMAEKQL